jgi:hypothetical protein
MYASKSHFLTLLTITFSLICIACDDDSDSNANSSASGPITSIGTLIGSANQVIFTKASECCNPTPDLMRVKPINVLRPLKRKSKIQVVKP